MFDCLASNESCPQFFEADNFIDFLEAIASRKSLYCQPPLNRGQPLILGQTNKGQDISEEFFLPSIPQKYQRINFTTFCPSLKKVVESKAVY